MTAKPVKFAHVWLVNPYNGTVGRATFAFVAQDNKVTGAVSFCSPKDRYYREEGRKLAEEALKAGKTIEVTIPTDSPWKPASALAERLMQLTFGSNKSVGSFRTPKWANECGVLFNGEVNQTNVPSFYRPTFDCRAVKSA